MRVYRKTEDGLVNQTVTLELQARHMWATPTARDWKDGTNPSPEAKTNALLGRQAPRATGPAYPKTSTRRLNPLFVEWLMGLPVGWTAFAPLGTESCPNAPPRRSDN